MSSDFDRNHVVSIDEFSLEEIISTLEKAKELVPVAEGKESSNDLDGKVLATLFFEPSTRTRLSFESAMKRLGGRCIGFAKPGTSSAKKGETLADTIRVAAGYSDIIVLRHPQEGAARLAANFSDVPVINAGDGAGHHPTQTLLDLFTIREEMGEISNNHIGLAGDLKYGRTVHSLTKALSKFDTEMTFISPPSLRMPDELLNMLDRKGISYHECNNIKDRLSELDVLYMTRIQRERFPSEEDYKEVAKSYHLEEKMLDSAKDGLKVLHPLPRVNEIKPDVDSTPNARYFEQAANGVPTRMALLKILLEG